MLQPDTWIQIFVLGFGFAGVGLTQWRGSIVVRSRLDSVENALKRLNDHVSEANASLQKAVERQHEQELICAANHGRAVSVSVNVPNPAKVDK